MIMLRTDRIKEEHIFHICNGENQEHWITTYIREISTGIHNEKLTIYINGHTMVINNNEGRIETYSPSSAEIIKNKIKDMNLRDREEYTKILSPEANNLLNKLF